MQREAQPAARHRGRWKDVPWLPAYLPDPDEEPGSRAACPGGTDGARSPGGDVWPSRRWVHAGYARRSHPEAHLARRGLHRDHRGVQADLLVAPTVLWTPPPLATVQFGWPGHAPRAERRGTVLTRILHERRWRTGFGLSHYGVGEATAPGRPTERAVWVCSSAERNRT